MPARENLPRYLPRSLGVLWLWSGLQPALVAPGESLQLLAQIGVPPALQQPLFYAASAWDVVLGMCCFTPFARSHALWGLQAVTVAAYTLIGVWQTNQSCQYRHHDVVATLCYQVRDPRDLAMIAAALMGACFGFLWWNASPAKIFMGDTGSLALGGALAGLSILSRTEFLAVILGGLFLAEVLSDVIQVASFKSTGRRVFRMAPLHHHFELGGWTEVNVVIRFWIVAGVCVVAGLGLFYAEYLVVF